MTTVRSTPRSRRIGAVATVGALAVGMLGFGPAAFGSVQTPGAALAAPADAGTEASAWEVVSGDLTWGVRHSIRNYLENFGHTEGWVAAADGATYTKGAAGAVFPVVAGGTVDPSAGTASLSFQGSLEMYGFGEDWFYFENVRIEVADGTADVIVDLLESYNIKEPVDDFTIASYELDADALSVEDGTLSLVTGEGTFSEATWRDHLPNYGGPTYAPPGDYTDPLTISLALAQPGSENPGGGDEGDGEGGGDDGEDGGNADGAYGVSAGAPLSGTAAYIRVTPGYAIAADGSTTVTVEGFHFDPGPAAAPGAGSGGIYVGLGTMKNPGSEDWRRSKGGFSGPVDSGDFTYGIPHFVGNQNSADADVADGVMDADGHWSIEMTIPGHDVPSFFGDVIDCIERQCGVFSFGAHGAIRPANEAYTPVYLVGQDESGWPDRDEDDPTTVPPVTPERPASVPSALPTASELVDGARGGVEVQSVTDGTATVFVGAAAVNTWVGLSVHSDPQFIDWFLVPSGGRVTATLPASLAEGDHKLSAITAEEELIGWAPFTWGTAPGVDDGDQEKSEPYGSSTGTNPYTGATLTVTPAWSLADSGQTVDLKGTGYATDRDGDNEGGAYVLFGWVNPESGDDWGPGPHSGKSSIGRSGIDFTYAEDGAVAGTFQSMVNYPGNSTGPGLPFMDADGSWEIKGFPIESSRFQTPHGTQIDCYVQQCGILTIGAHGRANAGVEVFTPVYFTDERPPNTSPVGGGGGGVVENPNVAGSAAANSGLSAATGLDALAVASEGRTTLIAGVLLLSLGVFAGALLFVRARRTPSAPIRSVA
ncbi:MAG: HtaA domain-containing protein [Microbacteriaceae bacterium]|uniref:HtaA domain-containing protein n=1 Tax=Microbacterium sp. TaxID=51671 RepID=UPI003F97D911